MAMSTVGHLYEESRDAHSSEPTAYLPYLTYPSYQTQLCLC